MTRNNEEYDYIGGLPFPRVKGKPHPAYTELKRQARLLGMMPFGLDRGVSTYLTALLIDRDIQQRPHVYEALDISTASLWYPVGHNGIVEKVSQIPTLTASQPSQQEVNEVRARTVARSAVSKWKNAQKRGDHDH